MAADVQSVNLWVVMASSAVIATLVNNAVSLWTRHRDKQREASAAAGRQAYTQMDVAHALEAFAQRASAYLYAVHAALDAHRAHEDDAFERVDQQRLAFEFEPAPVWTDLPIQLVADVRELPVALAVSSEWILAAFASWADTADAYELKAQQTMHYGLLAAELANRIRDDAGVKPSALVAEYLGHFERTIEDVRQEYLRSAGHMVVLPALEARFRRELATLRPSDEERSPHEISAAAAAERAQ
ncbi:hypothetical protein [Burkholderia gladioli]|uniref:hypothetical protein n=1 Tax=Burkholderia gladioli TaxID=28095 RepID=UPI00163E5AEB|nr:hypothetical protein [Burkholderia gladioli]